MKLHVFLVIRYVFYWYVQVFYDYSVYFVIFGYQLQRVIHLGINYVKTHINDATHCCLPISSYFLQRECLTNRIKWLKIFIIDGISLPLTINCLWINNTTLKYNRIMKKVSDSITRITKNSDKKINFGCCHNLKTIRLVYRITI